MANNVSASASAEMGIDDWLEHGDYSGGKFFKIDWKTKKEYRVWFHPRSTIFVLWRVVWKFVDDKGKLRLTRWNSMEDPAILSKFNFKDDKGYHEHSPQVDPFTKLIEFVDVSMKASKIGFVDEIFKFDPEDGEEETILAGGFTGEFQSKATKESDELKKMMRKSGVRRDEAFKHNCNAQPETVFIFVDNDESEAGAQICTLGKGPSKAFKDEIDRRKKVFAADRSKADPFKNPVCFSIERDDGGDFPSYECVATEDPRTDAINAAFEAEVPDTHKMREKSNVALLRQQMEAHWCHAVVPDWDDIFGAAFKAVEGTDAARLPDGHASSSDDDDDDSATTIEAKPAAKPAVKPAAPKEAPPAPAAVAAPPPIDAMPSVELEVTPAVIVVEGSTCDACDGAIGDEVFASSPVVCPHCGQLYEEDADGNFVMAEKKPAAVEAPKAEPPKTETRASRRPVTH